MCLRDHSYWSTWYEPAGKIFGSASGNNQRPFRGTLQHLLVLFVRAQADGSSGDLDSLQPYLKVNLGVGAGLEQPENQDRVAVFDSRMNGCHLLSIPVVVAEHQVIQCGLDAGFVVLQQQPCRSAWDEVAPNFNKRNATDLVLPRGSDKARTSVRITAVGYFAESNRDP